MEMKRKKKSSKCVKWNTEYENRANGTCSLRNPLLHHTNQLIVVVLHRIWMSVKGGKKKRIHETNSETRCIKKTLCTNENSVAYAIFCGTR